MKMGDRILTVRRANQGQIQPEPEQGSILAMQRLMLEPATQMVTEDELINDEDYEDILEDMRMERERFGFDIGPPASAILSGVAAVTVGFTQHEDHKKITFHEEGAKEKKQLCNKILIIHRKLKLKVCYND